MILHKLCLMTGRFFGCKPMLDTEPYIQTIHASDTRKVVAGEILCRVKTPYGNVLTNDHIGEIERRANADLYTEKMLNAVLKHYSGKDASYLDGFVFSINICMFQISSLSLRKNIENFIDSFPAKIQVQLEIVERGVPELTEELIEIIGLYDAKGVKFVMDDFIFDKKTVKYLEVSHISSVKFDRDLTVLYQGKLVHHSIIEALTDFAKKFGLTVVAEGVESMKQAELLEKAGVDYLQGFLFSKPVPLNAFDNMMTGK
ncbi:TPA: EAL domain-containing protein [Citrobacter freundii]|uniref:EAL domain-containing protein n=1 Tax=Citrobacter freundii TaxID=546 RepID=UPI00383A8893|nr:EAL domain-containing protein [Citrobacter freundii]